jgi:hypothetical protein
MVNALWLPEFSNYANPLFLTRISFFYLRRHFQKHTSGVKQGMGVFVAKTATWPSLNDLSKGLSK